MLYKGTYIQIQCDVECTKIFSKTI